LWKGGVVGNDAALSAQSKCAGFEHSSTGLEGGSVRGRGCRMGWGCEQMHMALLVMKVVCTTWVAVRWLVCKVPGVSRGVGTSCGGVLRAVAVGLVILEL
jgi:hypothetical protein